MRTLLFGAQADGLRDEVSKYSSLELVREEPEVVLCYGGDGTLLSAERKWPGVPKAPIRNSRRGRRCIGHPAADVIKRMADGRLVPTEYMKLECAVRHQGKSDADLCLTAMNEFNVHMGRINSAVRFRMWLDGEPFCEGREVLGDGVVVSTPFGSTAYFSHITRGVFHAGIGVAFQNTTEHINHIIVPEDVVIRMVISRGPATLAHDNSTEFFPLSEGCEILIKKHPQTAVILTWGAMTHPSDEF